MKNLKKALIVIAMLALIVASVAVVIGAEGDGEYSVTELNSYVSSVENELAATKANPSAQAKKLVEAYKFAEITSEQYNALSEDDKAAYDAACAKIAEHALTIANNVFGLIEQAEKRGDAETEADLRAFRATAILENKAYLDAIKKYSDGADYEQIWTNLNAKNAELIAECYAVVTENNDYTDASTLAAAETAMLELYTQMNAYPISDAELKTTYSLTAYDIARKMLDNYNALPDKSLTVDDVKDEYITVPEGETVTVAMKEEWLRSQYFNRINNILLVQRFINTADISSAEGYEAFMDDYADAMERRDLELAAKRASLDAQADLNQYDYGFFSDLNFDGEWKEGNYIDYATGATNVDGEQYKVEQRFETLDGETTGYQAFVYGDPSKTAAGSAMHNYAHANYRTYTEQDYGIVIEWDMRINEALGSGSLSWMIYANDKSGKMLSIFTLTNGDAGHVAVNNTNRGNSDLMQNPNLPAVTVNDAIAIGAWTHYSLTYNAQTKLGQLYINYQYICDVSYYSKDSEKLNDQFRMGPTSAAFSNWGGWDIDNYQAYFGNQVRITDKFDNMSDEDQFVYFVNTAKYGTGDPADETITPALDNYLARNTAYERAKALVSAFEDNVKFKETVELFKSIEYEKEIKKPAMEMNLQDIQSRVAEILDGKLTTENMAKKLALIDDLNSFISKNSALINKADTTPEVGYQAQMSKVYELEADIDVLLQVDGFIKAVEKFSRATALSALTRHAASAEAIYSVAFAEEANRELVKDDPLVLQFEQEFNGQVKDDGKLIEEGEEGYIAPENYIKLFDYYDSFAAQLAARAKYENSKKIINAVDYITSLDGYDDTVEFWSANYSVIYDYMNMIRNIVNEDNYDAVNEDVKENVEAALIKFREIDVYFYEKLQQEHIKAIEAILAKYEGVSTYIERYAVVQSAKEYFDEEAPFTFDTALNNTKINKAVREAVEDEKARLLELKGIVEVYETEVLAYEDAYLDVLDQQTQYFINTVNHMSSVVSFSEIVELFDKATTYYYGINVNVEGATEAAETYAEYRAYIAEVRENNAMLAVYAREIDFALFEEGAAKRDALYAALKNCGEYVDAVDASDSNVARYLATYNTELAKYEANVSAVKGAIYEAVQFTNAVRSESLPVTVLSVIGRLINN